MDETLLALFVALFSAQTALYTFLLLRLKRKLTAERPVAPHDVTAPQPQPPITESILKALRLLRERPLSAREVSLGLGLSREHTARLLKRMVETGLVVREGKPYKYKLTPEGENILKEHERP